MTTAIPTIRWPVVRFLLMLPLAILFLAHTERADAAIPNIVRFLDLCPHNDPMYTQIRADFRILRNRVPVGQVTCTEPVSGMAGSQITEELEILQALRVIYYLDRGRGPYLPWTQSTLYDWMKSRIAGFNIDDLDSNFRCCSLIDGGHYVTLLKFSPSPEAARSFFVKWNSLAAYIGLLGHEVRHRDGFSHDSLCGITNGCDLTYDASNLSSYGVQVWLGQSFLSGLINVGIGCVDSATRSSWASSTLQSTNNFVNRFSQNKPSTVTMPLQPGGACQVISRSDCFFDWLEVAYQSIFGTYGAATLTIDPYTYRYYPNSNTYIATSTGDRAYYLGPLSGNAVMDIGSLTELSARAACN